MSKFEQVLNNLVQYLSNHFELFFSITLVFLISFLALIIALKVREVDLRVVLRSFVRGILFVILIGGLISMMLISGYLLWVNYKKPAPPINFPEDILPTTNWVKSDLPIYFIYENYYIDRYSAFFPHNSHGVLESHTIHHSAPQFAIFSHF